MAKKAQITAILLIALTGLLAYSNTFNAPFQWDDRHYIAENPIIMSLDNFLHPSKIKGMELYAAFKSRYVGYLTFALNYRLQGLDVTGYHTVNIAIHIVNALLVYALLRLTLISAITPPVPPLSLRGVAGGGGVTSTAIGFYIPLFAALLFVSHPVQTEAVTYVFQRLASLSAFFYLLSLVLYAKWRLTVEHRQDGVRGSQTPYRGRYLALYLLSLLCSILAMKTKENAFTLPIAIALYEFIFFDGAVKKRMLVLLPFMLTMLIVPISLIGIGRPAGEIIGSIGPASRGYLETTRWEYLITQFCVIATYIRLLFLPVGQNVDYDYPIMESLLQPQAALSLVFILLLLGLAVFLLIASRKKSALKLPAFGIIFFFLTLSVESSVIPLPMVINEYRVYLPSAGLLTALVSGLYMMERARRTVTAFLIIATAVFAASTFQRNGLWASETALWEDAVAKSPIKARPHNNLGLAYIDAGLKEKAELEFKAAIALRPDYSMAHYNLALQYKETGRADLAIRHFEEGLRYLPDAEAHNSVGALYGAKGMGERSAEHYIAAIRIKPDFSEAHFNLGLYYIESGLLNDARREFFAVLEIDPESADALRFLDYIQTLSTQK